MDRFPAIFVQSLMLCACLTRVRLERVELRLLAPLLVGGVSSDILSFSCCHLSLSVKAISEETA